jgi:hypothetical protein
MTRCTPWVQTNDLAELQRRRRVSLGLGRFDNVINSGGVKVQVETCGGGDCGAGR